MLRQSLKDAVRKRTLNRNPTDFVKVPTRPADDDDEREERTAMRAMSEEDAGRFLDAALASGMSREEILADYPELEPEDIDACLRFARDRVDHPILAAAQVQ